MEAYHVKQWWTSHETAESRKYRNLSWIAVPVKHDGLGMRHVVRQANAEQLLAGWKMITEVAGRAPRECRGWLVRNGQALTAADLALMTGLSEATFAACLNFFVTPPADWLEVKEYQPPAESPGSPKGSTATPGRAGRVPEGSAVVPGDSPGVPEGSAVVPGKTPDGVQYPTVPNSTNLSTEKRERGGRGLGGAVAASRTQAGVLMSQIRDLERQQGELSGEERQVLRKKKAALAELQKKQAAGEFETLVQTSGRTENPSK